MITPRTMTSVALYFAPERTPSIPVRWFEGAYQWLSRFDLSPILFTAAGGDFLLDDCYTLSTDSIVDNEGYVRLPRREQLLSSLKDGTITSLAMDAPRYVTGDRSDWQAMVDVSLIDGTLYFGVEERILSDLSALVYSAWHLAGDLLDICYGIGYKSLLVDYPNCYARGISPAAFYDIQQLVQNRDEWPRNTETADELWRNELVGTRRHLTGHFRGAYSVNVLSEHHLKKARLQSHNIGILSQLCASLWLWTLSNDEIPIAEELLKAADAVLGT